MLTSLSVDTTAVELFTAGRSLEEQLSGKVFKTNSEYLIYILKERYDKKTNNLSD